MDIYREKLLDHYNNPRNYGVLKDFDLHNRLENLSCGDLVDVQIKIEKGVIKDMKFTAEGCAVSIAAASILSEIVKNKPIHVVQAMQLEDLLQIMGVELTVSRMKCANLSLEATKQALEKKSSTKK